MQKIIHPKHSGWIFSYFAEFKANSFEQHIREFAF